MTEFRPSRFEILPPVIKNLLIINGLVFLAQSTLPGGVNGSLSIDDMFALHAWQSNLFKPWQLITHLFMHGGFSHIFFNMLALWMFGAVLENVWGSKRFLTFYLICGLGAALIHLLFLNWEFAPIVNDYATLAKQHMSGSEFEVETMTRFVQKYHLVSSGASSEALRYEILNDMSGSFQKITSLYQQSLSNPTVGASGAIFGVLAAFGYLFPNTYLYVYMLVPVKAKWFVL
ncbi:MAG: rane protein of glp regulon GlpG, partial [Sediminibacterium sp.]|nr:rane protein of glp regulon GlpG [Sediminibacterium sp.]